MGRLTLVMAIMCGLMLTHLSACLRKPALAPAGDTMSAIDPPPMGATTYNDELKRELALLDDLLAGRIEQARLHRLRTALMSGQALDLPKDKKSDDAHLVKVLLTLPELIHDRDRNQAQGHAWLKAKYLFLNRRFVEASTLMSEILQKEDDDLVRNWRARAIFFLGNPDLAVSELNRVIAHSGERSQHGLDALYLIGAINYESNDTDKKRIATGIDAWSRYLSLAEPSSDMSKEIQKAIVELKARLDGPSKDSHALAFDRFSPNAKYSETKNAILKAFAKEELLLALKLSEQALRQSYDADIATIKARILFKTGQLDEAMKLFSDIVAKDSNYAPGYHYRGMAFMLQGRPKDAIVSWQKTLELDEKYGNIHGLKQRIAVAEKMVLPTKIETH